MAYSAQKLWNWLLCICTSAFGSQFKIVAFRWNQKCSLHNSFQCTFSALSDWSMRASHFSWLKFEHVCLPVLAPMKISPVYVHSFGVLLFINRTAVSIVYFIVIVMECKRFFLLLLYIDQNYNFNNQPENRTKESEQNEQWNPIYKHFNEPTINRKSYVSSCDRMPSMDHEK